MRTKWSVRPQKRLGVFVLPLGRMLVHRRVTPQHRIRRHLFYTWVKRSTVRKKCLSQEHNENPRPGLKPETLDPPRFP